MMDEFPILDRESGLKALAGQADTLTNMTNMLIEKIPEYLDTLKETVRTDNPDALDLLIHELRAPAMYCGALRLHHCLMAMYKDRRANPDSPWHPVCDTIHHELKLLRYVHQLENRY